MPYDDENNPLSQFGGSAFGADSRDNLARIMNRFGNQEPEEAPPTPVAPDLSKELEALRNELNGTRSQMSDLARKNDELRSIAERASGSTAALQQFISARPSQPQPIQEIEIKDPEMAALAVAIERRITGQVSSERQHLHQELQNMRIQNEMHRFRSAVETQRARDPEFSKMYNDETLNKYGQGIIFQNPQAAGQIDWNLQFETATRHLKAPQLEAKLADTERELAEYKKREADQKAKQKANLHRVPAVGQRGSFEASGSSVGERIMNDFYGSQGRRPGGMRSGGFSRKQSVLKLNEFSNEYKRRMHGR